MKFFSCLQVLFAVLMCLVFAAPQGGLAQAKPYHDWWNDHHVGQPIDTPALKPLPRISVKGTRFVNPQGDTVLFRGLAISDPDKIEHQGHWNRDHFRKVKEMGATVVRIPVHPISWRERTPRKYLALLDSAVAWCTELGIYVMIDWHSIGNLRMQLFQDPMYVTTQQETFEFWRTIARHFKGTTTPAFYELFNEPTLYNGELGRMSWSEWKKLNEDMISLIRAFDRDKIILVAGLDWAYDLTPILVEPIEAEGIAYVSHPYPHKRTKPYIPKWEEDFGFAANRYPVFVTEFGFTLGNEGLADNLEYGKTIIDYLESKGISWVCWVFDPEWTPRMLETWNNYQLTETGQFFKQALQAPNAHKP